MDKIKVLLWDIDGTVLNFLAAEKAAIRKGFAQMNLGECTDEMLAEYSLINRGYWEKLERGEMSKPEILVGRFHDFFVKYGIASALAKPFNDQYQIDLGDTVCFNDDCYQMICSLNDTYLQCAVTNGTAVAQHKKLRLSGLDQVFKYTFISDEIGYEKPSKEYFDRVFSILREDGNIYQPEEMLIIGDSLTSDITGGENAGIKTCWYNPGGAENNLGVRVDLEIRNLQEMQAILKCRK